KLLEELEEPPLASEGGAEIGGRQRSLCLSKSQPKRYQAGPGTADGFVELLPGPEVIVLGLEPGQVCALHQAAEQIGRKKCAFSADVEKGLLAAHVRIPSLALGAAHKCRG